MSDEELTLAIAELQEVVRCRCDEAYRDRGLKDPHCECDSADAVKVVADRIEALTKERDELQVVVDKQGALLADAYGADLDWEEVLKQRADHEAVKRIEALTEQLAAARDDAKEAEAYAEELEKELRTTRMAQAVMDNTVADLEGKLAKAVEALDKIAGVNGPYSHPFPEDSEGYGAFAVVKSREALGELGVTKWTMKI